MRGTIPISALVIVGATLAVGDEKLLEAK